MKIQITKGDLLRVLSARFAVEVSDVEVISDKENISLADAIRKVVTVLDYKATQKIVAIKALRQVSLDNKW